MPTSDYSAILQCLNICGARYLVVGGYAVMRYSEPRFTKDLDLWIDNGPENIKLVLSALRRFGAPVASISAADLQHPEMVLQIGVAPVRVDILTSVPGLEFEQSWHKRETILWDGVETLCFKRGPYSSKTGRRTSERQTRPEEPVEEKEGAKQPNKELALGRVLVNNVHQYGSGSGTAAPSLRGSEAPNFTPVEELYRTAWPPPISVE
jgi:hypothetical protein